MFESLSSCKLSLVLRRSARCFDMFFLFAILAAEIGIVFANRDRSRVAAAERTIGGRKRVIALKEPVRLSF
jgi:hypothetical protein